MKTIGKILSIFLFFSIFSSPLAAHVAHCHEKAKAVQEKQNEEKIYVNPEQVEITKDAIIVWSLDGNEFILAKNLALDDKGLYIKQMPNERDPCGLHNLWCRICGGCGVIGCPMNCTCFD